jgi:hypothetical protein
MPNWVYNNMTVTGGKSDLEAFAKKASEQRPEGASPSVLSFFNFVRPADDDLANYHETGWYEWNIEHWGTKWDACDAVVSDVEKQADGIYSLDYGFNTAWADPREALEAIVSQHPELSFYIKSVEEQGWGVEYSGIDGDLVTDRQWDIPETHAERINLIGYCDCEAMGEDETDWMFDECPKKKEKVTV